MKNFKFQILKWVLVSVIVHLPNTINAQQLYQFTEIIDIEATPVISQGNTGTC